MGYVSTLCNVITCIGGKTGAGRKLGATPPPAQPRTAPASV